jgi:hypothetical protein
MCKKCISIQVLFKHKQLQHCASVVGADINCVCVWSVRLSPHTILYLGVVLQDKQTKIETNDTYVTQPGYRTGGTKIILLKFIMR